MDEYVDRDLVTDALTVNDRSLVFTRGNDCDRDHYFANVDDDDDPLEYGPENEASTRFSIELGTDRLLVFLERAADDPAALGNIRVYGPGQWLREALWAGTAVIPRECGPSHSDLFGDGYVLAGYERFELRPIPGWEPLP